MHGERNIEEGGGEAVEASPTLTSNAAARR